MTYSISSTLKKKVQGKEQVRRNNIINHITTVPFPHVA